MKLPYSANTKETPFIPSVSNAKNCQKTNCPNCSKTFEFIDSHHPIRRVQKIQFKSVQGIIPSHSEQDIPKNNKKEHSQIEKSGRGLETSSKLVKISLQQVPQPLDSDTSQSALSPGTNSILGGVNSSFKAYFGFDSNNELEESKEEFDGAINLIEEADSSEEVSIDTLIDVEKALSQCPRFMEFYRSKTLEKSTKSLVISNPKNPQ